MPPSATVRAAVDQVSTCKSGDEGGHALRANPHGSREIGLAEPIRGRQLSEDTEFDRAQAEGGEFVSEHARKLAGSSDHAPGDDLVDVVTCH